MKNINSQEDLVSLKCLIFASIISADNDRYTESVKQEIMSRYNNHFLKDAPKMDWAHILQPLGNEADKYVELLEQCDATENTTI